MSTIYTWAAEHSADATGQAKDYTLIYDTSSGRTKKATLSSVFLGQGPARIVGFYGEAGVIQPTMTATALTALAAATISAANTNAVFGFGVCTTAKAVVKRMSQIQANLDVIMGHFNDTGLINITGL